MLLHNSIQICTYGIKIMIVKHKMNQYCKEKNLTTYCIEKNLHKQISSTLCRSDLHAVDDIKVILKLKLEKRQFGKTFYKKPLQREVGPKVRFEPKVQKIFLM